MDSRIYQAHMRSTNNIRASPALPLRNSLKAPSSQAYLPNRTQNPSYVPEYRDRKESGTSLSHTVNPNTFQIERGLQGRDSASTNNNADLKSRSLNFSKGTVDVLAKANQILQKSSQITVALPNTHTQSDSIPVNQRVAQFERAPPSSGPPARNFSAKTSNVLDKANEILKRSNGYSKEVINSNFNKTSSGIEASFRPRDSANNSLGITNQTDWPRKNNEMNTRPPVEREQKMHNIFSRIDEVLQKSSKITSEPISLHTTYPPHRNVDIQMHNAQTYQGQERQRSPFREEALIERANVSPVVERRLNNELHPSSVERRREVGNVSNRETAPPPAINLPTKSKKPKLVEEEYEDGTVYKGQKIRDSKHGRGNLLYPNGSRYDGEWENDSKSGYGIQTFPNGNAEYDGEWKEDAYHGNGILMNGNSQEERNFSYRDFETLKNNWIKYEGEFSNGKMHGLGTLTLLYNERYVGKFKQDKIHGAGVFYKQNGEMVSGEWEENKLIRTL